MKRPTRTLPFLAATVLVVTLNLVLASAAWAQPVVTTLAATSVTTTNATLNGTVNPKGAVTTAYFQYGLTANYGSVGGYTVLPAVSNSTITLPGLVLSTVPGAAGTTWTQSSAPSGAWRSIASSADGTRLAAAPSGGGIYVSTNSGATWTQSSAPDANWASIASSADGMRLAAVVANGGIWISTNGGAAWTGSGAPTASWSCIASSADGMRLVAAQNPGFIWTSADGGATWAGVGFINSDWYAIASSADGTRLAVAEHYGLIYTSTDSGATWTESGAPTAGWYAIASSADGMRLAAVVLVNFNAGIYTSSNRGVTWTLSSPAGVVDWISIATSADGTRLAAVQNGGGIWTSTNSAATWTQSSAPGALWQSIASSADGTRLAAAQDGGGIWTSVGAANGGLTAGTVYHFRLVGFNSAGTSLGSDLTFTTGPIAPLASTLAASNITGTDAMLNGAANPNGAATKAYFRYGLTTNYGSFTATNNLPTTNATLSVSSFVSGLVPSTTYHYQLVCSNSVGAILGADRTFTTTFPAPIVATLAASSVTATNARLNGSVNPGNGATTAYFQYGLTTNYGSFSTTNSLAATNATLAVSNLISSLAPSTTYHFRIVGINVGGTSLGADLPFTTAPSAPAVTTLAAPVQDVTQPGDMVIPTSGNSQAGETSANAIDDNPATKYLNFDKLNAGFTVTPSVGDTVLVGLRLTSANDAPERDPTSFILSGSRDGGSFTEIAHGSIPDFTARAFTVEVGFTNTEAYLYYRLIFPTVRNAATANSMQIAEVQFPGSMTASASATLIGTGTNATLNGTVNPNGAATTAYFQYGLTTNYGSFSATNTLAATNTTLSVSKLIGSLTPGTTYHFRLVAQNSAGTNAGVDQAFTTSPLAPTATTFAASSITATSASLNGSVNPNGAATTAYFQYGLTTNYGSFTATNSLAATNTALSVSNLISGLTLATTYHFRLVALNSVGTNAGVDLAFTTSPLAPTATTLAASSVTAANASLNGSVNPGSGATTAYFRFGLTTNYGSFTATNTLAATNTTLSVSNLVSGLTQGTTYHFRLVALNSAGTNAGVDLAFTTSPLAPTATTLAASSVTATNARLNGSVNPGNGATSAYFQYGLTTNYGSFSATNSLAATNTTLSVSNLIASLAPGTTYHFRLVGSNSAGATLGSDLLFTTASFQPLSFNLNGSIQSSGGAIHLSFTNLSGLGFTVLGATNPALPLSNWTVLGAPIESPPGQYQFTDPQATNKVSQFYRVRSP